MLVALIRYQHCDDNDDDDSNNDDDKIFPIYFISTVAKIIFEIVPFFKGTFIQMRMLTVIH